MATASRYKDGLIAAIRVFLNVFKIYWIEYKGKDGPIRSLSFG